MADDDHNPYLDKPKESPNEYIDRLLKSGYMITDVRVEHVETAGSSEDRQKAPQPGTSSIPPNLSDSTQVHHSGNVPERTLNTAVQSPVGGSRPGVEEVLGMENKQRSAWGFMEYSVRPQKASRVQLDRFCFLLQRPGVFDCVRRVVRELEWDQ